MVMHLVLGADITTAIIDFLHGVGAGITQLTGLDVKSMLIGMLIICGLEIPFVGRFFRRG